MIQITRSLIRQLRTLLRRAKINLNKNFGGYGQQIRLSTLRDELRIQALSHDLAIEYACQGGSTNGELWLPSQALADSEGRGNEIVTFSPGTNDKVTARWSDRGVPRFVEYTMTPPTQQVDFPTPPSTLSPLKADCWAGFRLAGGVTDPASSRYALGCLQLRGKKGQVVATDGRQVLIEAGYEFPWQDDVLVPASGILGCRELEGESPFNVGRTDDWLFFSLGPWSIGSRIEKDGRYPQIDTVIPQAATIRSRLILSEADALFLQRTLPTLPGHTEINHPVTIDLNGQVCLRSRGPESSRATELILSHSRLEGEPVAINTNRDFLARAIDLGFRNIGIGQPHAPILCEGERGKYIWSLLEPQDAIKSSDDALRIESALVELPPAKLSTPSNTRSTTNVAASPKSRPATRQESQPVSTQSSGDKPRSPIELALALRDSLRAAANEANDLARSLKRQRRENQLSHATLTSLQQLEKAA